MRRNVPLKMFLFYFRKERFLPDPDDPTRSPINIPDSEPDQYVVFQRSSVFKDIANYTIPLFETLPVTATPSVGLAGIGLFHKGAPGSGGFLAFKIFTIDLSKYVDFNLPEDQLDSYESFAISDDV